MNRLFTGVLGFLIGVMCVTATTAQSGRRYINGRSAANPEQATQPPFSGAVVKTEMNAADPVVRCQVTVTFRRDEALDMWVPDKMEEYYKAYSGLDDILATATYTNVRKILRSELEP